jgi:hypothetical protein
MSHSILIKNIDSLSAKLSGARRWHPNTLNSSLFLQRNTSRNIRASILKIWIPAYASKGYKYSIVKMAKWDISWTIRRFLKGGGTGLPSFGPNRTLIVLSK